MISLKSVFISCFIGKKFLFSGRIRWLQDEVLAEFESYESSKIHFCENKAHTNIFYPPYKIILNLKK